MCVSIVYIYDAATQKHGLLIFLVSINDFLPLSFLDNNVIFYNFRKFVDPTITCFEPEAMGNLIVGMDFHKFYFDHGTYFINIKPATLHSSNGLG